MNNLLTPDGLDNAPSLYSYGLDEAGRGCLAGPVIAAVVLFSPETDWSALDGLDDSKKLSSNKRTALVPHIKQQATAYGIGLSWQREVDAVNIVNATFRAMCRAIIIMQRNFSPLPDAPAYVDGNLLIREDAWRACALMAPSRWHAPYFPQFSTSLASPEPSPAPGLAKFSKLPEPFVSPNALRPEEQYTLQHQHTPVQHILCNEPSRDGFTRESLLQTNSRDTQEELAEFPFPGQKALVGGDGLLPGIAAASILAKTTRDALMERLHTYYPHYGFAKHKGYGTKNHQEAIRRYGPCPLHRRTFIRNIPGTQEQLPLLKDIDS